MSPPHHLPSQQVTEGRDTGLTQKGPRGGHVSLGSSGKGFFIGSGLQKRRDLR